MDCPCVADMKNGPCGSQFADAFRCFVNSKEEEKGSECVALFKTMQSCMEQYPEQYSKFLGKASDDDEIDESEVDEEDQPQTAAAAEATAEPSATS